ncbi:MAG: leucine--tRNA ligase [Chitinophagaceae bacterium]|nr:leucine--tRNA ligase [Chitinophagaceae bacterium]
MEFNFSEIEKRAKEIWSSQQVFLTITDLSKPKYYVLDMFPYPSGAGLHVGHPLGYIGSDIIARYKRLKGFNVLHPMGYDSFGLPAEQYAIQTGQHPAITTEQNINTFREQMDKLGFSFDWSREVRTSDPKFYKWTQWIFIQLFHSWYNVKSDRAESIETLISEFEKHGTSPLILTDSQEAFTAEGWKGFSAKQQSAILLQHRLAYIADSWVNWCPALGTVLANDEVKDGVSERGGYPVERKLMKQWSMRITVYAERLRIGLDELDWSESIKEAQRNWIGKSEGASVRFTIDHSPFTIEVFTTRPDTIFGVSFITLAPEHELVNQITTDEYREAVNAYVTYATNRSERDRMSEVKKITGQFTGAYVLHPFTDKKIPVWIGDYVLATYGTGAVMAVPGHDTRDYAFAKFFEKELTVQLGHLPIVEVIAGGDLTKEAYTAKEGVCVNSGFLDGLQVKAAIKKAIEKIEEEQIGQGKINFRLRDAIFGRQRYWGEPIPVYYDEEGIPLTIAEEDLPLVLPVVDKYLPTESGEPPLARASENWKYKGKYQYELTTMPGWAGSCWYYLRYEDPNNENAFASKESIDYWQNIDFYLGGDEHATGHLLYFRFWTKFLFDRGWIPFEEPAKKLLNQGKIQGVSQMMFSAKSKGNIAKFDTFNNLKIIQEIEISNRPDLNVLLKEIKIPIEVENTQYDWNIYVSADLVGDMTSLSESHIPISIVNNNVLDIPQFLESNFANRNAINIFLCKDGRWINEKSFGNSSELPKFYTKSEVEKMSKSKYNVINPDDVVGEYGADAFRLYEMFLGPIEQHKPWDTKGIDGVYRFLKKMWKLFYDENGKWLVTNDAPSTEELKVLHRTIKKVAEDIERLSFNTSVSAFMICVNELTQLNCHKKEILEALLIILSPYAPFVTEYLWEQSGNKSSIVHASFPVYDESLLVENAFEYPIAINGKTRLKMNFALDLPIDQIEQAVKENEGLQKYFEGKSPKKVIVVKGRMINVVV